MPSVAHRIASCVSVYQSFSARTPASPFCMKVPSVSGWTACPAGPDHQDAEAMSLRGCFCILCHLPTDKELVSGVVGPRALGEVGQWSWGVQPVLGAGKPPVASSAGTAPESCPRTTQQGFAMFQATLKHKFSSVFIG